MAIEKIGGTMPQNPKKVIEWCKVVVLKSGNQIVKGVSSEMMVCLFVFDVKNYFVLFN